MVLTPKQHDKKLYDYQKRTCIQLALLLEMKSLELSFFKGKHEYHKVQELSAELDKIKSNLDLLWEKQVNLFFKINN